ncbi:MAG: hydantoinase/oxoprolinase N-terminal domain-containing protein [Pseudohongiellaceae bacterium]
MLTDKIFLGIDAGGTFTDFVALRVGEAVEVEVHKTLSTPDAPEQAILAGIEALGLSGEAERGTLHIIHGSTVATNAALEGKNAPTAYVTNYGFGDTLMLGRQTRPALYALEFPAQSIPVPSAYCLETGGRMSAEGKVLETLTSDELQDLVARIRDLAPEAVAINLLFSFLDDSSEVAIEKAIADAGVPVFVSRSSAVLPVYKEYERGIATWLNASLGPVVSGYLSRLRMSMNRCSLRIMQSNGETLDAEKAAESAVRLLLSGPVGGLIAMKTMGEQADVSKIISFDMGGTSTDVALLDGEIATTSEGHIGPYPVAVPMVDMHTIGAGGGSIALFNNFECKRR